MSLNDFIHTIDWDAATGIGTWFSVAFTIILTAIIIFQTYRLHQKQIEHDKVINKQQLQMQKRQIKLDLFPYRREMFQNLIRVIQFSRFWIKLIEKNVVYSKDLKTLHSMYESSVETYIGKPIDVIRSLKEADYLISKDFNQTIIDMTVWFESICSKFMVFKALSEFLAPEDQIDTITSTLSEIITLCQHIVAKEGIIITEFPAMLDISKLDK